jgi:uncharacterized protein YcbX
MPRATVAALSVYPVKGCRGMALSTARLAERGLVAATQSEVAGDREWMIVDGHGRFVTQREHPRLALIETGLVAGALVLQAPGTTTLKVALAERRAPAREVVVWESRVRALDAGDEAAHWLSAVLGADVRLMRFDASGQRRCDPAYVGDSGAHTAFADGYPLLVIGEASLDDLNARLVAKGTAALPMNRFRPNIVLAGLDPYDEDHVDTVAMPGITLKLVKPCTRCVVTATDQATARVGAEPLATLGEYRMDTELEGVAFGMNAIVVRGSGQELSVGASADCTFAF